MKIIKNKHIPYEPFSAINICGVLFVREYAKISKTLLNHEEIHTAQIKELWYIFFYLWYIVEWVVKILKYKDTKIAYRNISFEKEAYNNERNLEYLDSRKKYSWIRLIR